MIYLMLAAICFVIWVALMITSATLHGMGHLLLVLTVAFLAVHMIRGHQTTG